MEDRIKVLEDELAIVRGELGNLRRVMAAMDTKARENERQALLERDEAIRNQLSNGVSLVQDQRDTCDQQKEIGDARWEEKKSRRQAKDNRWTELQDIVRKIQDNVEGVKNQAEEARIEREAKPGIENVIEELQRQNAEQRELLNALSDSWRADCARQHQEIIETVRSTAQEQVPFNVKGYLDQFSKGLASEVRMLLGEVGKLREERRGLQHELGFLLCMKSKYGPGGEFDPEWKPPPGAPGGPPPEPPGPPEPPLPPDLPPQVKPAWRAISSRIRKKKNATSPPTQYELSEPLASHAKIVVGEVGKLHEERRALQYEIGVLLCLKSKYGPGGEFESEWRPPGMPNLPPIPPELSPDVILDSGNIQPRAAQKKTEAIPSRKPLSSALDGPPEPSIPSNPPAQAKPAWRMAHPIIRTKKETAPPAPESQAWALWQPNPLLAPSVPEQPSPGLFGPKTPSGSILGVK